MLELIEVDGDPWLADLLRSWHRVMSRLARQKKGEDLPWVYREETQAGVLACAAAELKMRALVETGVTRRGQSHGALDPQVERRSGGILRDATIEVKRCDLEPFKSLERQLKDVREMRDKALKAVKSVIQNERCNYGYGIVSVEPKYGESQDCLPKVAIRRKAENAISRLVNSGPDFCAAYLAPNDYWGPEVHRSPAVVLMGWTAWEPLLLLDGMRLEGA